MTTIYNADCITILKDIPDESIDMVMTSPPYDNLRTYNGAIDQWNFDKFKAIAKEIARILVRGGGYVYGWSTMPQSTEARQERVSDRHFTSRMNVA